MSKEYVHMEDDNTIGPETLLFLDTTQIIESDATNVRPYSHEHGDSETEIEKITVLANTIEEEGQLQPVLVRKVDSNGSDGGMYELIAGRRRKRAIELINAGRKAGEELKVRAILNEDEVTDPHAFRQAAFENLMRESMSPMDMCGNIATVRKNFKWHDGKGTKKVAEFFKVSTATITQYEKLNELSSDVQMRVHRGELSRDDAFKLVTIKDKKGEVKAQETLARADTAAVEVEREETTRARQEARPARNVAKKKKAAKSKVIREAAREADPDKPQPRSRKEILEYFDGMQGPAYGFADGAVHKFVVNFRKWSAGEITTPTLDKYWDTMVEKAYRGAAYRGTVTASKVSTSTSKPKK